MRLLVDVRERDRHERRIDLGPELGFVAGEVVGKTDARRDAVVVGFLERPVVARILRCDQRNGNLRQQRVGVAMDVAAVVAGHDDSVQLGIRISVSRFHHLAVDLVADAKIEREFVRSPPVVLGVEVSPQRPRIGLAAADTGASSANGITVDLRPIICVSLAARLQ